MNKLREARFQKNLTQIELQNRSGIHRTFISFFENEHLQPSAEQKRKLAKALAVRIGDIWGMPIKIKGNTFLTARQGMKSSQ